MRKDCDSVDVAIRWAVWTVAAAFVAACLVTLLALWTANEAKAAGVTPEQEYSILRVAYGQFTGPPSLLKDPPKIHIVSQAELQDRYKCAPHCRTVHGLYDEETGEIYLYDGLDFSTVYATTVLMHEYIHHFQVKTKGRVMDMKLPQYELCLEVMAREHEAYRLQWQVLLKVGEYMLAQSVRLAAGGYYCKKPETQ